ncbi:MAG: hypothetical protein LQ337_005123 [Flavoplaca oasis]|nr:MAG: hypothetical protein LQ337_005123 [Flavoplaca oasis]
MDILNPPTEVHHPTASANPRSIITADMSPLTDLMSLTLNSLKLDQANESNDQADPNLCTTDCCPLAGSTHNKGLYLYSGAFDHSVQFHEDFGYSNPPPFVWAAYFRYVQHMNDRDRGIEGLRSEVLGTDPYDDFRDNDLDIVKGFLRFHAVMIEQRQGEGLVEVQWRGTVLRREEGDVVEGLEGLRL